MTPLPLPLPLPLLPRLPVSPAGGPGPSAMLPDAVAAVAATGLPPLPGRPLRPLERERVSGRRALPLLRSAGEVRRSQASDTAVNDISGVSACHIGNRASHCQHIE